MPGEALRLDAPAKVNLFLHAGEKRADGYHALESLVAFADYGDVLEVISDQFSLVVQGPFAKSLGDDDNLILRAVKNFAEAAGISALEHFELTKNLPVASGLGGGSADAAAALRAMAMIYSGALSEERFQDVAAATGSDVPACLVSRALLMRGRGERVAPVGPLPEMPVVLVNPGVSVSTAEVFRHLESRSGAGEIDLPKFKTVGDLARFLRTRTANDLEAAARGLAPEIGTALSEIARMPGVLLSRMSGSGATCFGLFETRLEAEMAATALQRSHPGWWVVATTLR